MSLRKKLFFVVDEHVNFVEPTQGVCSDCGTPGHFKICAACTPPNDKVCDGCIQHHLLTQHNICEEYQIDEL